MQLDTIADAALLGVIEGLTEFVPVSSTAHLLLAKRALGLDASWDTFVVVIQLGAILAIVVAYFATFWDILLRLPKRDPGAWRFVASVVVAFLPAAVLGVLLFKTIKGLFESPVVICLSLIVGGIALLALDRLGRVGRYTDAMRLPIPVALGIGVLQCMSLIPGVSRSGATIGGGLILRCDRRTAAEFSFFLAIPTMLGATVFDLYKNRAGLTADQLGLMAIGFVTAFVSALIVVRLMIGFVSRNGFGVFAYWRMAVGIIGLVSLLFSAAPEPKTTAGLSQAPLVELAASPKADQIGR